MATQLSQRVDYELLPDGRHKATLTITLPDGTKKRFSAIAHDSDFAPEIGGLFSGLGHLFKRVGKLASRVAHVAKKIATSKVFLLAAGALATMIPGAGLALGPALMATAATLGVASKLIHAGVHAKHGNPRAAAQLTDQAHADALKLHGGDPAAAAATLAAANTKRKNVDRIAEPTPAPALVPASSPLSGPAWL